MTPVVDRSPTPLVRVDQMLLVEDATFDLMPKTGIAVLGIEQDDAIEKKTKGIVTALAEDMLVLAIVFGPNLDEKVKAAVATLPYSKNRLRCTFFECSDASAFEYACKLYHREWVLAESCEHPELDGRSCSVPMCDGT